MDLSVIIPARNEKYLQNTIDSVLANIEADTEIIVILDGCWPDVSIPDNPRVTILHHTEARGQRQSINEAARIARGKFLMKLDAHCAVGPGFDRILITDWQPGNTYVPTMYNLDVATWQPKRHKRTDYMYIGWNEKGELRSLYYEGSEWKRWHRREAEIDETMTCMGPGWFLSAEDFWKQGGCDEAHGSWGQQGVEVSLKAWLSGGALLVNKKTWFAHWFRGNEGFPYPIKGSEIDHARKYSKDLWTGDKWPQATRKLSWLVEKFNPPGWEGYVPKEMQEAEYNAFKLLYHHIHGHHHPPLWRGVEVVKMPTDLALYHQVLWDTRPEIIVEIGTRYGGSALFLQDQLDLVGGGQVVTVDIKDQVKDKDPRICYLLGNSTDPAILTQIQAMTAGKRTMVILDGDHRRIHVKWELKYYAPLVTPGCYLVVEDCTVHGDLYGPGEARDWFMSINHDFVQTNLDRQFIVGVNVGGWLRRK